MIDTSIRVYSSKYKRIYLNPGPHSIHRQIQKQRHNLRKRGHKKGKNQLDSIIVCILMQIVRNNFHAMIVDSKVNKTWDEGGWEG